MDILAARKKAAERSREQKPKDPEPEQALEPAVFREEHGESERVGKTPSVAADSAPIDTPPATDMTEPQAAPEQESVQAPVRDLEMLSFRLGGEEYAVNVDDVKEVLKTRPLTLVPNAPDYVSGIMAVRGVVLPVIDLGKRLGLPAGVRDEKTRILVVTGRDEDAGIIVDRVTGVVKIGPDSVRPIPETIESGGAFLRGIARKGEKLYILLDTEKVLGA